MLMNFKQRFFKKELESPPRGEIAFESSGIYSRKDFPKYDPDTLKGWQGWNIYNDMMRDDQVKACMLFKQYAILSRGWYFDIGKDENENPREDHKEISDVFTEIVKQVKGSFSDKLVGILSGLVHGFSITEKVYGNIEIEGRTYWSLKDLKLKPSNSFSGGFEIDDYGNVLKLIQSAGGKDIEVPYSKVIHFVNQPEKDLHYGESDLRAAYRSYHAKDIIIKFQNLFLERFASGFAVFKSEGTLTDPQKSILQDILNNLSAATGIILPGNIELDLVSGNQTNAFERAIAQHDKSIAKSILVPNLLGLSEQGQTGSYSQSQTQLNSFFWVLDYIATRLEECLNEQLFTDLALWNFGTKDFPWFKFEPISDEVKQQIASTWADLMSKGAVTKSDSDESFIRQLLGFPAKAEPEETPRTGPAGGLPEDELPNNEGWIDQQPEEVQEHIRKYLVDKPWLKRIDFARLEYIMDDRDSKFLDTLNHIMGQIRKDLEKQIAKIVGDRSMINVKPKEIENIKILGSLLGELKKRIKDSLQSALDDGYNLAKKELPKKIHAKVIRSGMDKTQAEVFLGRKAMKIAGVLERDILDAVQRVLENGIKYDKTLKDIMAAIGEDTDLLRVLPEIDAAGRAINVPARLENIVRTNNADAINQARQALFGQPEFRGFVLAYEYSAVLDSRVTDICEQLNGRIMKDFGAYTPPNHYQCRSILIPVTTVDEWDGQESRRPNIEPQKGFM